MTCKHLWDATWRCECGKEPEHRFASDGCAHGRWVYVCSKCGDTGFPIKGDE